MFDRLVRIDGELEFFGELSDLRGGAFEIECDRAAWLRAEHDVLGDSHRLDEHEVLVDHADAERDSIVRRFNVSHLAVEEDLAAVRSVEAVSDAHRSRLPRTVLTDNGVDRAGFNDDVDVIVGEYVAECFGYLSEF